MAGIAESFGFTKQQLQELRREVENKFSYDYTADERQAVPVEEYSEMVHVPRNDGASTVNTANNLTPQQREQNTNARMAALDMSHDIIIQRFDELAQRVTVCESLLAGRK